MREHALQTAVVLFWEQGVDQTSYADLVRASGLSRKTLYQLWPDKKSLVQDALAFYVAELRQVMILPFRNQGRLGLEQFLQTFIAASQAPGWNGCFLMRSAAGPLRADETVAKLYANYIDELTNLVAQNVQMAMDAGEWSAQCVPEQIGRQMAALAVMLSVFASQPNQLNEMNAIRADMRALLEVA